MELIYILSLVIAVLSNTILIIILTNRVNRNANILLFILLLYFINLWGIPQIIVNLFGLKGDIFITVDKISALGYTFIPIAFFLFALSFVNKLSILRSHLFLIILFLPAVIFLFLAWNTNSIEVRNFQLTLKEYWGYRVPIGQLFPLFSVWFELLTISSIIIIYLYYRTTLDITKKKQAVWFIIAFLIPLFFGTFTNAIFPILKIHVLPSAIPLTSIMALIIAYAVIKYELFDFSPLTILSSLGDGIITVNKDEQIVQINKSAMDLLGLHYNVTGYTFKKIISFQNNNPGSKKNNIKILGKVLNTGQSIESENYSIITSSKKKFPVEFNITPVKQGNKITGAALSFRDISKEKELEKNKNEFISIASHELKTPITAIKAYSQVLQKKIIKDRSKKYSKYINNINDQIDKITMLINDLLNVGKIEAGKLELNKNYFSIDQLVNNVVNDFKYISIEHKIIKKGKIYNNIFADKERIRQVLINLISNAIKYSPRENKVIVRISTIKNNVIISVRDFGIGIPLQDRTKIFGRFYRSSYKSGEKITGFGLGLYISSEIIKRHKGKIWVKCPKPKGSIFYFTLPISKNSSKGSFTNKLHNYL